MLGRKILFVMLRSSLNRGSLNRDSTVVDRLGSTSECHIEVEQKGGPGYAPGHLVKVFLNTS